MEPLRLKRGPPARGDVAPLPKDPAPARLRLPAKFPADRIDPEALVQTIRDLFPVDEVQRLAKETGFQERERKLDVVAFLLTLAL